MYYVNVIVYFLFLFKNLCALLHLHGFKNLHSPPFILILNTITTNLELSWISPLHWYPNKARKWNHWQNVWLTDIIKIISFTRLFYVVYMLYSSQVDLPLSSMGSGASPWMKVVWEDLPPQLRGMGASRPLSKKNWVVFVGFWPIIFDPL